MKKITWSAALFFLALITLQAQVPCPVDPGTGMVFIVVEDMPRFPGCEDISNAEERRECSQRTLLECMYNNQYYPQEAFDNNIEGTVVVSFVVEETGCLSEIEVVNDIGSGTSEETIRLIELMNEQGCRWIPGQQQGNTVRVRFNLPIRFRITDSTRVDMGGVLEEVQCCDPMSVGVQDQEANAFNLQAYPSPASNQLLLASKSTEAFKGHCYILDIAGQLRLQEVVAFSAGSQQWQIDVSGLRPGLKLLLLKDEQGNLVARKKITIVRE